MVGHHGRVEAYGHDAELGLPTMDRAAVRRRDEALHVADRGIGVGTGGAEGGGARMFIFTDERDPDRALERARRALAEAGAPESTLVEVVQRRLSPGRPRRVATPSDLEYRTLAVPDGRVLRAAHEGPAPKGSDPLRRRH